jgi:hypothetical protein
LLLGINNLDKLQMRYNNKFANKSYPDLEKEIEHLAGAIKVNNIIERLNNRLSKAKLELSNSDNINSDFIDLV